MTLESKESVLSRWSRRKLEADIRRPVEEQDTATPTTDDRPADAVSAPAAEAEAKPVLTDADMPDIESLDQDSDFSGFMSGGVSDELRNLALRKLFRAPVFNIRDGLDEYDEDYTTFEKLGDIVTCDMKHRLEMEEQKLREKLAAESEASEPPLDEIEAVEDEDVNEEDEDAEQPATTVAAAEPESGDPAKTATDE